MENKLSLPLWLNLALSVYVNVLGVNELKEVCLLSKYYLVEFQLETLDQDIGILE